MAVIARKQIVDGRELIVFPISFNRARLAIGPVNSLCLDDVW